LLPYNQLWFYYRTHFPYYRHWNYTYTTKGLIKLFLSRGAKLLALIALITGFLRLRRKAREEGMTIKEYVENLRDVVKMGVKMGTVLGINKAMKRLKDVRRGILEG